MRLVKVTSKEFKGYASIAAYQHMYRMYTKFGAWSHRVELRPMRPDSVYVELVNGELRK